MQDSFFLNFAKLSFVLEDHISRLSIRIPQLQGVGLKYLPGNISLSRKYYLHRRISEDSLSVVSSI